MTADTVTLAGREAAVGQMVDACLVTAPGTVPTWDETTGLWTTPAGSTVYAGKCRVQMPNLQAGTTDAAQVEWALGRYIISVPMTVPGLKVGQTVTVTASVLDPALVGLAVTVRGVPSKSFMTARRLQCEAAS